MRDLPRVRYPRGQQRATLARAVALELVPLAAGLAIAGSTVLSPWLAVVPEDAGGIAAAAAVLAGHAVVVAAFYAAGLGWRAAGRPHVAWAVFGLRAAVITYALYLSLGVFGSMCHGDCYDERPLYAPFVALLLMPLASAAALALVESRRPQRMVSV